MNNSSFSLTNVKQSPQPQQTTNQPVSTSPSITNDKTEEFVCNELQKFFEKNSGQIIENVSTSIINKIDDSKILNNFVTIINEKITEKNSPLNQTINEQMISSFKTVIKTQMDKLLQEPNQKTNSSVASSNVNESNGGSKSKKSRKNTIKKIYKKMKKSKKNHSI